MDVSSQKALLEFYFVNNA